MMLLRFPVVVFGLWALVGLCGVRADEGDSAAVGEPVVINPNGGWSWFGDERAVIDPQRGVLYVGSLANRFGAGGKDKDGDVEVTRVDLATGAATIDVLHDALLSYGGGDDHNVASLLVLPDGRVLAAYTGHNNDACTFFRTFDPDSQTWSDERTFDWNAAIPGGCDFGCTYNNLFTLPGDGTVVNISRNHHRCPNVIVSHDLGESWEYAGQLLAPAAVEGERGTYVNGYLKYAARGDRIDLLATERHPRNYSNSLYHGYLAKLTDLNSTGVAGDEAQRSPQDVELDSASPGGSRGSAPATLGGNKRRSAGSGWALHQTDGQVVDHRLDGEAQATAVDLTTVFPSGTVVEGVEMNHAWMIDFERYPDGTLATVFETRAAGSIEDHRFFYAVCRDGQWKAWPLAQAGPRLFAREEDYTGLAALDPNTPDVAYISTPIDPASGRRDEHHELYQGRTSDGGQTWQWRAVTANSPANNLRPIIPRWASRRTALLWNRGSMKSSQNYDMQVMLLIDPFGEE